jgi:hypothetical protein
VEGTWEVTQGLYYNGWRETKGYGRLLWEGLEGALETLDASLGELGERLPPTPPGDFEAELAKGASERDARLVAIYDLDGDGVLGDREVRGREKFERRFDLNRDGELDAVETERGIRISPPRRGRMRAERPRRERPRRERRPRDR